MLGYGEILLILLLVLLVFGGKKIPEVARGLGKGLNEFKKARDEITDSLHEAIKEDSKQIAEDDFSDKKDNTDNKSQQQKS